MDTRTSRDHGRRDAEWIDCHFHLNTNGLDEAQAVEMLPHVIEAIGASAVSISCVAFPLLRGFGPQQLPLALRLKARFPDRVYVFGALDYSEPDAREGRADFAAQARRLHDLGVDGFKMIEGKPTSRRVVKLPLDAPAYDPFYAFLVERSLPLLAHVADPAVCWDADNAPEHVRGAGYFYANKALPTHETFQAEALSVARRHPRLKLTLAHFFFASTDIDRAARILEEHPRIAFDLTPGHEMHSDFSAQPDAWRDFFIRFKTRLLYGTDCRLAAAMNADRLQQQQNNARFVRDFLEREGEVVTEVCGWPYRTLGLHLPADVLQRIRAQNFLDRLSPHTSRMRQSEERQP